MAMSCLLVCHLSEVHDMLLLWRYLTKCSLSASCGHAQVTGYLLLDICLGAVAAVVGACAWPTLACSEMQIRVACALEEMGLAIDR